MSIDETDTIDLVTRTPDGAVRLVLTDHLPWGDEAHLMQLQEKLNAYIAYVETGQVRDLDGVGPDTRVTIEIVMKHAPDTEAREFLFHAGEAMAASGLALTHEVALS